MSNLFDTGSETVNRMCRLQFTGNVIPSTWYHTIKKETGKPNGKIGKIEASALNQKDVAALLKKVAGGCLIIEKAGDLSKETALKLSLIIRAG